MEGATDLHSVIAATFTQETADIFENAAACDTALDMLNVNTTMRTRTVGLFVLISQLGRTPRTGGGKSRHV